MSDTSPQRVIIDCDPGIGPGLDADDGLAILFALASPELRVEAVTTIFGNVEVRRATDNALRVLDAVGRTDVPVAMGMSVPLAGRLHPRSEDEFAQQVDRLKPIDEERLARRADQHAVDLIIEKVTASPGEIALLAVGPLTNVAMAILKEPALKDAIPQITIMGGAFGREPEFGRGNITPVAELNIWGDPLAADIVFTSGIPVTAAGLDVTNPAKGTVLYEDQLLTLLEGSSTRFTEFLDELCRTYIEAPKFNWARKGCVLYDPVAAATLVDRSLVTTARASVRVETTGEHAVGQTVDHADADGNVDVCVDVDGEAFTRLFMQRMRSLVEQQEEN
jgi:inosine-uridine nucleoside N-ribohydrolase